MLDEKWENGRRRGSEIKMIVTTMALTFCLVIIVALAAAPVVAGEPDYDKKVRTPVWPGLNWLYEKIIAGMVAPNLDQAGGDALFAADMASESFMGASNYATALSNGRLFVEVSPWAELTVLRWPNPTYSD